MSSPDKLTSNGSEEINVVESVYTQPKSSMIVATTIKLSAGATSILPEVSA